MGNRVEFFSFTSSISNHESLISSSNVFFFNIIFNNGIVNFVTLLVHCDNDSSDFIIHTYLNIIISDFFDCLSGDLFDVDISFRVNFTENHTNVIFDTCFASNFTFWILF